MMPDAKLVPMPARKLHDFLQVLHPDAGYRDLRALHLQPNGQMRVVETFNFHTDDLDGADMFASTYGRGNNIYVGVATRADADGRKAEDCTTLHALFVDLDFKASSEAEARARLAAFPLAPSVIIASGGGLQIYWLLENPIELRVNNGLAYADRLLKALCKALDGDPRAAEPARILRLPGTLNNKYDPPRLVEIETFDDQRRYSLAAIENVLPKAPDSAPEHATAPTTIPIPTRIAMARSWLSAQPPAIQGEHGDSRTFSICCAVAVGYDLSPDDALTALRDWNARCQPLWSEHDLRQKLSNAAKYAGEPRGGRLIEFHLTEVGDAECFANLYQDVVRFDHRQRRWLVSDLLSGIWVPDPVEQLTQMSVRMMRVRQQHASFLEDAAEKQRHFTWARKGEDSKRLRNTLALARSVPPVADVGDNWDQDAYLLGTQNGVVDLRTGQFRKATPDDRITMRVRVAYDGTATCPLWLATINSIFAPKDGLLGADESGQLVSFIQRAIGYSATGDCREECCFFLWGEGSNGKGTIMNTLGWLLADYTDDMPYATLEKSVHGRGIPNDVAKLAGKRFITCSEVNEFSIDEPRLKALTGRDPITARYLRCEYFTFIPVGKIWIATNNKPRIAGTDDGIWRRIHLVPFLQKFEGSTVNKELKDKLREELPGILNWVIAGAQMWLREGLNPPASVRAATAAYRNESNPITPFVESCCQIGNGLRMQAADAMRAYESYCKATNLEPWLRLSDKAFHRAMRQTFEVQSGRQTFYLGIGLRAEE